jgi:peptide/nickel transport system substrate-binding protein
VSHADFLRAPTVSNGPFVFEEWVTGSYIRFVRNENYWKDVWMDEVQLQFFQDATVIEQLFEAHELDQTNYILPASRSVEFSDQFDYLDVRPYFDSLKLELRLNMGPNGHPALKDVRVRKAILMAIDRQFMVDEIYDGLSQVANSFWGTTTWENQDIPVPEYDPEGAIALLAEAGWLDEDGDGVAEAHGVEGVEDGMKLEMIATTYSEIQHYQDSLLYIQDALSDIGLSVDITLYTIPVIHSDWNANSPWITGIHDLYLLGWWGAQESIGVWGPYACADIPSAENPSGQNAGHICNERMDALWNALFVTLEPAERQAQADEIQYIMADEALTLYLLETAQVTLYNTGLEWESHLAADMSPWLTVEEWRFVE